jgi:hypothetical protein
MLNFTNLKTCKLKKTEILFFLIISIALKMTISNKTGNRYSTSLPMCF